VGYWDTTNGAHAFLYQAGTVTDLGLLGGNPTNNYALSVNNAGQVVGFSETINGAQAFLYQNGALTDLGNLGGSGSYAFDINGSGQIVGHVDTPDGARAILYDTDTGSINQYWNFGWHQQFAFGVNNTLQVTVHPCCLMTQPRTHFCGKTEPSTTSISFRQTPAGGVD